MSENRKNIIIWSSVVLGGIVTGTILYSATTGKRKKITELAKTDKEMQALLDRIEKAPI
jgi:hypothetical protein